MSRSAPDRILSIDVLRGFSLMGLFLIHMMEYFELYWYGSDQETGTLRTVVMTVFSGKAYSMFALLFGVTFFILLEQKGDNSSYNPLRFLWRMVVLAGIGYVHSLIYPGDILQQLAVCGVFLLLVHRAPGWVLVLIVVLFLGRVTSSVQFYLALKDETYVQPAFWSWSQINFEVYANAGLADFLKHTATTGQIAKWVLIFETGSMWNMLGLVVAGLLLARMRWFDHTRPARVLVWTMVVSALFAAGVRLLSSRIAPSFPELMPRWCFDNVTGGLYTLGFVVFYLSAIPLILRSLCMRRVFGVLAPAGRMSLTFYFGQSLFFVPMFYGFGLGWYDKLGQTNAFLIALAAWVLQLIVANLWIRRFRHGPLEGLWRWLCFLPGRSSSGRSSSLS